jgi:hypothetical protein
MHSRIFQVSNSPIGKDNYITPDDFYEHWFTNSIADYVDTSNRTDDIEWLRKTLQPNNPNVEFGKDTQGKYFSFNADFKTLYFKPKFESFMKAVNEAARSSLEEFASDSEMGMIVFRIKTMYDDKYSFYFYEDDEFITMDEFIRYAREGQKYYIGGTIDYHM